VAGGVGPLSPFVASGEGPSLLFISGGVGPCSLLVCGGVGPSSPFMPGAVGPSFTVCGAGGSSSWVDSAAGAHCFLWVEVLGARRIVCRWWWYALVSPFLGGVPSWVFVCHVVLLPFEGEGGGWSFVFAGAPSIVVIIGVVLHHFCVLSSRVILVACPWHHVSSLSLCVLTVSLSRALLIIVLCCCCCCALVVTCHLVARRGTCVRNIGRGR